MSHIGRQERRDEYVDGSEIGWSGLTPLVSPDSLTPTLGDHMLMSSACSRNPRSRQMSSKSTSSAYYLDLASPSSTGSTWTANTLMMGDGDRFSSLRLGTQPFDINVV